MSRDFPQQDFDRLLAAFKAIGQAKSELERQFWLSRTARYHGLSKAEARRFFGIWVLEQIEGGQDDA